MAAPRSFSSTSSSPSTSRRVSVDGWPRGRPRLQARDSRSNFDDAVSRDDATVAEVVDNLAAARQFNADAVLHKYLIGDYERDRVRASLFGALRGRALHEAVNQVMALEQQVHASDRSAFSQTFAAVLAEAAAEMEEAIGPEGAGEPQASPAEPPPLDIGYVIRQLSKGKQGDTLVAATELFGGRTGADLRRAIDEVEQALDKPSECALDEDDRSMVREALGEIRRSVGAFPDLADEAGALPAFLPGFPGGQEAGGFVPSLPDEESIDESIGQIIDFLDQLGSVDEAQPQDVVLDLQALRTALEQGRLDVPSAWRKVRFLVPQLRPLPRRSPAFDLKTDAFKAALRTGGMKGLNALLKPLSALQQWNTLSWLVEDQDLVQAHPRLLVREAGAYRRYMREAQKSQPLEGLLRWYRSTRPARADRTPVMKREPPAVPRNFDPEEWIRLLRIMLYQQFPERSPERDARSRAIDAYKAALNVITVRDHAQVGWLDPVDEALNAVSSGHALLKHLRGSLPNDAQVALAVMSALENLEKFPPAQQDLLYRAGAILIAEHDHCLPCIAMPYLKSKIPQRLNIVRPPKASASDPVPVRQRAEELREQYVFHLSLVEGDDNGVLRCLSNPPLIKSCPDGQGTLQLSPGEQLDRVLCGDLALPPQRWRVALTKFVQSGGDHERVALARRWLSELVHSERNYAGRNKPMSVGAILCRMLGVFINGPRESVFHLGGVWLMRVVAERAGNWAFPVFGTASSFALPLWAWHYIEKAKSPDYRLNPNKVIDALFTVIPPLIMVTVAGVMLTVGISALPGVPGSIPVSVGEALTLFGLARGLRQLPQSATQPFVRLFRLVDRSGAGLSAQLTFFMNCFRDLGYVASSVGTLVFMLNWLKGEMAQWGPVASDEDLLFRFLMLTIPTTLNETIDGWLPDITILLFRAFFLVGGFLGLVDDHYMLQPSVPLPLEREAIFRHLQDHVAGRVGLVALSDVFNALSAVLFSQGHLEAATVFLWLAAVSNGLTGSMRTRSTNNFRINTPETTPGAVIMPQDGFNPRNPDGLLVALFLAVGAVIYWGGFAMHLAGDTMRSAGVLPSLGRSGVDSVVNLVESSSTLSSPHVSRSSTPRTGEDDDNVQVSLGDTGERPTDTP